MKNFLKNIFGIKPRIGDAVCGSFSEASWYRGRVINVPTQRLFPCYEVDGEIHTNNEFGGETVERKIFFIPEGQVLLET